MQYTLNTKNIEFLREVAAELDKGDNADILWLKYQGPTMRQIADALAGVLSNSTEDTESND